ncbi:glutamate--ammonia-ligase adenylyltransferase [Sorangium cellulosum]|uniref:Glutamate--ammonia-ligase adenylyltransferase n=1 Tax=Sorangium cellulosum TaxID=56 RepID=A0A2L0ENL0_SORCE|nr:bifunctional [glutamate--ammonia ligase]-adenylyl-L-tyrosine phosphorylase/[glutamate--ammonia-ligase] adenylyltransferase [Sorangium cellulosum]AUX40870.1 glutamate--ammonia-ligase adenylyltransferase [Sorangium cellulosum]
MQQVTRLLDIARAIDPQRVEDRAERLSARLRPGTMAFAVAALLTAAYPAIGAAIEANPDIAERLAAEGHQTARDRATYLARIRGRAGDLSDADRVRRELRRVAREERIRIALRELLPPSAGGADVDVTSRELTELAEATIEVALAEAVAAVTARFGEPRTATGARSKFVVLGMGKLGGEELNAGSDVDLIYLYDTDDGHVGPLGDRAVSVTLHDFWARVARRLTSTLEEVTEDGFVWRVDLRLRPEGRSGPLVNSLAAAERYYESFGRLWERAALLRAREIAGDLDFGAEALSVLGPFVWRRQVDPQLAADMIDLVERARSELPHDASRDLKLGPGGIREAEFFVQALQLIWGGREPRARAKGMLDGLRRLRALGYVTDREGRELVGGYLALRRAEHAVQSASGVQTHQLPDGGADLDRLARALRFDDAAAFLADLEQHRGRIKTRLQSLLPKGSARPSRWTEAMAALDHGDREAFAEALAKQAVLLLCSAGAAEDALTGGAAADEGASAELAAPPGAPPEPGTQAALSARFRDVADDLFELSRHPDGLLGARSREASSTLAETLLAAVVDAADPEQAARFLRRCFTRIRHLSVYARMLGEDPRALRRLIEALGSSAFIGDAMVRYPELVDVVLFARGAPGPDVIRHTIQESLSEAAPDDDPEEALMSALRRAKARVTIEVGLADLSGEVGTREATNALSDLADASLEAATRFALGTPAGEPVRGLAVIAMGKLGGREIGYGSDLDVFFLFDPARAPSGDVGPGSDPATYYARRARQIIRLISMSHASGPGYELDTRLRPSGSQGLLVTSVDGFARYHGVRRAGGASPAPAEPETSPGARHPHAAIWERLALIRARAAAGDPDLGAEAIAIAHEAAYLQADDFDRVGEEIHRLRLRMERELSHERRGRRDFKLGRGGLADIEFSVQFLQMRHGVDPRVRTTETLAAIDALAAAGYLSAEHADAFRDGHAFLRKIEQRIRIVHADASQLLEENAPGVPLLARRTGIRARTAAEAARELLARYGEITGRVRKAYDAIVGRGKEEGASAGPGGEASQASAPEDPR